MLTERVCASLTHQGAAGGLILGIALSFWVGIGAFFHPAGPLSTHPLHLSVEGCQGNTTSAINTTITPFTGSTVSPTSGCVGARTERLFSSS